MTTTTSKKNEPKRLILLGSTGSIGVNTLTVVNDLCHHFRVVGLAANSNAKLIIQQAQQFNVQTIAMSDKSAAAIVSNALPDSIVLTGQNACQKLVQSTPADQVISAVVGTAAISATLEAISHNIPIALANKETLVAAGELVMPLAEKHNTTILPIDSEHSAIFQCLLAQSTHQPAAQIKRVVLTASGGPFLNATKNEIQNATIDQALNHPVWNMGQKVTIDSATMMNKAMEIIEAHWLFDLKPDQIQVIIHPQSIVHSFVEFTDNSILAQLGTPDMKTPIQYALTHPTRTPCSSVPLDWSTLTKLEFLTPDYDRFPSLNLAYRAIKTGGTTGTILNAANEVAVDAFLNKKIPFTTIVPLVQLAMDSIKPQPITRLDTILKADHNTRNFVKQNLQTAT